VKRALGLAAVLLAALIVGGAVVAILYSPPPELGSYSSGRADLGAYRASLAGGLGYNTDTIASTPLVLRGVSDPAAHIVFAVGVSRPYSASEIEAFDDFVTRGGVLVVADDFGFANTLAVKFGVTFDKVPLLDSNFQKNVSLARARALLTTSKGEDLTFDLLLNEPTALTVSPSLLSGANPSARIVATSSPDSYLDNDGNRRKDDTDTKGPFPQMVVVAHGRGTVMFIADPALFTNEMLDAAGSDNRKFALALPDALARGSNAGTILFDESRHAPAPQARLAAAGLASLVVPTKDPFWQWIFLGSLGLAIAVLLALVKPEERLTHHRSGLARVRTSPMASPIERITRLARERVRAVHGVREESPAPETLAVLATDDRLRRVVRGENGASDDDTLKDLLTRIRNYGKGSR